MVQLMKVDDPLSKKAIAIQKNIFNSDLSFNQLVTGENQLTEEEIIKETEENLQLGANYYYVTKDEKYLGLMHYLPTNPHDGYTWIGLLIIHKKYQKHGIGGQALKELEDKLTEDGVKKVRLCVQQKNENAVNFWQGNKFLKMHSSIDKLQNEIDIYEKTLNE
ncbi:GNAT family N-acetyltransferase [Salipaludibacillus daqingensis]|uniref:GNAT family N-acetyltransferase n=1 Tax=Salipaludibacillus daqingensis TaxID=3041001 RepID=UPI0024752EF8|nr:GNAT family N-acetyltransferase [Salipaludibacillus daqingensis]